MGIGDFRLGVGISSLFLYQFWTPLSAPFAVGGMMDSLHLSASTVGLIVSVEVFTFALAMIFLRGLFTGREVRHVAAVGLLIVAGTNLASAFVSDPIALAGLRFLAGGGAGIAARAGLMAITSAGRVDRTAAGLSVSNTLVMSALLSLCAIVAERWKLSGLFLFFAAIAAVSILPLLVLPPIRGIAERARGLFADIFSPLVLASVAMAFGFSAVWAFAERIGVSSGLSVSQVGMVIGLTALPGVFGGIGAFVLAARGREVLYTGIGLAGVGLTSAALALSHAANFYIGMQIALAIAYVFVQPFFLALSAKLDRSGNLAASMTGWSSLVSALAPAAAGTIIELIGSRALVGVPLICTGLGLSLLFVLSRTQVAQANSDTHSA